MPKCGSGFVYCICIYSSKHLRHVDAWTPFQCRPCEAYVPKEHRQFLDRLRNAPQSVKRFVESRKNTVEEKTWYALAGAFNACISRVLDFRWRHWSFVEQFIVRPSTAGFSSSAGSVCPVIHVDSSPSGPQQPVVGTGGTTFDYLQQHITDSQMARIPLWSKHDILQRTPELQAVQAHVDKERKDLANIPPLNEVDGLWDAAGPNGFVTHRLGALNGWCSGFKAPHPGCQALAHLAASIPTHCFSCHEEAGEQSFIHPFVARCDARQEELESLVAPSSTGPPAESLSIADLEHAWLLLCHVACAYRSMKAHSDPKVVVDPAASTSGPPRPAALAKELENDWLENVAKQFAEIIDRPFHGVPEYAELVLNNWYVPGYPSNGKEGEAFIISRENIHLVQPACRFLALPDEEWYRKLHLVLEAEGGRAIAAAHQSIRSAMKQRNNREIVGSLCQLASDIDCLSEFQRNQFDNKDSRGEAIMMQRLRPFVSPNLADTEFAVWIYTEGSSPLLPALHAILGLRKLDGISGPLQEHWQQQGRVCMPANHRDFLDSLESEQSVRAYCLREWRHESVEGIAALEDAFNNCIEALLRYCSLRQRLVLRMFPGVAKIKNLSAEQEQVIRTGRVSLLQMRRVADAQRMHLSTKALSGLLPNVGGPPKFETCGY
ncbi:pksN [Symbiodinium necroappetens]|uniref:PksN protein n=1 Tax=Symbiodinium necroappetens TaxID=1628268 RepID=A0A812WZG2_9DINO|nr:pksN [Symbiodinium necroappetens]